MRRKKRNNWRVEVMIQNIWDSKGLPQPIKHRSIHIVHLVRTMGSIKFPDGLKTADFITVRFIESNRKKSTSNVELAELLQLVLLTHYMVTEGPFTAPLGSQSVFSKRKNSKFQTVRWSPGKETLLTAQTDQLGHQEAMGYWECPPQVSEHVHMHG